MANNSVIVLSDSEEEVEAPKPKTKKTTRGTKKSKTGETKAPKTKTTKTPRKRKAEEDDMGGLLCKKSKTSTTKSTSKRAAAKTAPPAASAQKETTIGDSGSQSSGFSEYTPSPTTHLSSNDYFIDWTAVEYIHEQHSVQRQVAETIVKLFNEDNTVPFIARYRRAATQGLDADELRLIKESYDRVKLIKHKADLVIKAMEKVGKWTPDMHNTVRSTKSLNELEHLHTLYKTAKRTLAERARDLGLGPTADDVLQGRPVPHLRSLVITTKEGLQSEEQVREGIVCIMADVISKDKRTFDKINELREKVALQIETKKSKTTESDKKDKEDKYDQYYNWSSSEKSIKPHQILAINRAESQKIITVKLTIPDFFENSLKKHIFEVYSSARTSGFHHTMLTEAFAHAYKKSIKPAVARRARSEMNEKAESASMEVFAINVKQLLLTSPVRGKVVLGVDPGFAHGCKLAVVSQQGDVLETATIYPHKKGGKFQQEAADTIALLIRKHQCTIVALGNATACRETEVFLSDLIKSGLFSPIDVNYTIVDEAGASVYSCSGEAKSEFPKLDYNVISAISIARRLQDPLAELVKVEPKHLGVGMYQHDLPEKQLMSKLNEVVMEAVSFVGVDVNTASQCLLRRVAGLSETKATNIIEWRRVNGPFVNRNQLMKVKGIGAKSFEQCAGFIRIQPETASSESPKRNAKSQFNYLDQTWIHPESYSVAHALITDCGLDLKNIGTRQFISAVNIYAGQGYEKLAKKFKTDVTTLDVIIKGLTMAKDEDIRLQNNAPLFRNSLRSINDLTVGAQLSGEVRNVTHFGAFVDIGVGKEGLIHISNLRGETLRIGQRVDVKVQNIEKERGRIGLILIKSY